MTPEMMKAKDTQCSTILINVKFTCYIKLKNVRNRNKMVLSVKQIRGKLSHFKVLKLMIKTIYRFCFFKYDWTTFPKTLRVQENKIAIELKNLYFLLNVSRDTANPIAENRISDVLCQMCLIQRIFEKFYVSQS